MACGQSVTASLTSSEGKIRYGRPPEQHSTALHSTDTQTKHSTGSSSTIPGTMNMDFKYQYSYQVQVPLNPRHGTMERRTVGRRTEDRPLDRALELKYHTGVLSSTDYWYGVRYF